MKRYSILGVRHGEDRESEIAQCDTNPEAVVNAAREQQIMLDAGGLKRIASAKWSGVRIRDNAPDGASA